MTKTRRAVPLYAVLALALLAGVGAHRVSSRTFSDASAYHARVKEAVDGIPFRIGDWVGEDIPIPPSATALLKPNALMARSYRTSTGVTVSVAVLQCQDTRDMAGHYPPICFPAHGWKPVGSERIENILEDDTRLPMTLYRFERPSAFETAERSIYNLLILPGGGGVQDMPDVRKAAANPQARQRGAAQIQIALSTDIPDADQRLFVKEFVAALVPTIQQIIQFEPSTRQ